MTSVLGLVRAAVAPLTRTRLFRALGPVLLPPLERLVRRLSGGRVQLSGLLVPSLVLHTTGARSGQRRDNHLMYTPDGHGSAIVAGTTFAQRRHPGWTYNLLRRPDASISVRGRELDVRAELIDAAPARELAWSRIEAQWPGYRAYERASGRTVRLFRLRPVAEQAVPRARARSRPTEPARRLAGMSRRRASEPIYSTAIVAGRGLFGALGLKRHVTGVENVPDTGGAVLAMTHFGYLEFALVEWVTWLADRRRIRFMAKQSVFDSPVTGPLMRGMRHIAVDMKAGAAAYAKAVEALRGGELLGVFPEAGVSASFTVRELKTGAVRLAAEAGVPVIPVAVWGGHRLLTKGHRVGFLERFGVPVSFAFGAPITVGADEDARVATGRLRERLQELVDRLQREYPVDGTGAWWQPRSLGGTAPTPEEAAASDAARDAAREARRAEA